MIQIHPTASVSIMAFRPEKGGIQIEDDVWIGAYCVTLEVAVLGQGCVLGFRARRCCDV